MAKAFNSILGNNLREYQLVTKDEDGEEQGEGTILGKNKADAMANAAKVLPPGTWFDCRPVQWD